jgi:HPt (histidine-containing phosphotransfer) domain-containing protein
MGGDRALYRMLVGKARKELGTVRARCAELVSGGNRHEAVQLLHSARSVAGLVGAAVLAHEMQALERSLAQPTAMPQEPELFQRMCDATEASLQAMAQLHG